MLIEKKFWFENYRWFIGIDGNIIIDCKDKKTKKLIVLMSIFLSIMPKREILKMLSIIILIFLSS